MIALLNRPSDIIGTKDLMIFCEFSIIKPKFLNLLINLTLSACLLGLYQAEASPNTVDEEQSQESVQNNNQKLEQSHFIGMITKVSGKAAALVKINESYEGELPAKKSILYIYQDGQPIGKLKVRKINRKKRLLLCRYKITSDNHDKDDLPQLEVSLLKKLPRQEILETAASPVESSGENPAGEPDNTIKAEQNQDSNAVENSESTTAALLSAGFVHQFTNVQTIKLALGLNTEPAKQRLGFSLRLHYPFETANYLKGLSVGYMQAESPTTSVNLLRAGADQSETMRIKTAQSRLDLCYQSKPYLGWVGFRTCLARETGIDDLSLLGSSRLEPARMEREREALLLSPSLSLFLNDQLSINVGFEWAASYGERVRNLEGNILATSLDLSGTYLSYFSDFSYQVGEFGSGSWQAYVTGTIVSSQFSVDDTDGSAQSFQYLTSSYRVLINYSL